MHSDQVGHPIIADECGSSWYAIYTRHQHEKTVAESLVGKGFEVFLPLSTTVRQWKDRRKAVSLPLFPCYVFLNWSLERRTDVLTTPGTCCVVSSAGQPSRIPLGEMEALKRAVQSGLPIESHRLLASGDRVRVKCGPLQGLHGVLARKRNQFRLVLSVEMLGKAASVQVDASIVEKIDGNRP